MNILKKIHLCFLQFWVQSYSRPHNPESARLVRHDADRGALESLQRSYQSRHRALERALHAKTLSSEAYQRAMQTLYDQCNAQEAPYMVGCNTLESYLGVSILIPVGKVQFYFGAPSAAFLSNLTTTRQPALAHFGFAISKRRELIRHVTNYAKAVSQSDFKGASAQQLWQNLEDAELIKPVTEKPIPPYRICLRNQTDNTK